jgi:hypothetical protein
MRAYSEAEANKAFRNQSIVCCAARRREATA